MKLNLGTYLKVQELCTYLYKGSGFFGRYTTKFSVTPVPSSGGSKTSARNWWALLQYI